LFKSPLLLGFLFGLGALAGDAIESFFKRQANVPAGAAWFPFDQIDYIAGGCLAAALAVHLRLHEYATVLAVWFLMHLLFSYIGYLLHLKARPV
jgi:CDP-2,3-bis-(O-geranylgeranyl)-sn-glycerol synthase